MPKFMVEVTRIGYACKTFEIEADNEDAAHEKALAQAGNHLYTEKSSEYEVTDSEEKTDGRDL